MNKVLLEESEIVETYRISEGGVWADDPVRFGKAIALAQARKIVEWLFGQCDCPTNVKPGYMEGMSKATLDGLTHQGKRIYCWKCRQELRKVVGL